MQFGCSFGAFLKNKQPNFTITVLTWHRLCTCTCTSNVKHTNKHHHKQWCTLGAVWVQFGYIFENKEPHCTITVLTWHQLCTFTCTSNVKTFKKQTPPKTVVHFGCSLGAFLKNKQTNFTITVLTWHKLCTCTCASNVKHKQTPPQTVVHFGCSLGAVWVQFGCTVEKQTTALHHYCINLAYILHIYLHK